MDDYWYRLHFKLRLYEASGNLFQQLAVDVLNATWPDFVSIAPSGPLGDGGNDGYIPSERRYFQMYGPQPNTQVRPADIVRKAREDFAKLRQNYPDMRRYSFVFNDRFQGIPRDVDEALRKMAESTGVCCDAMASRELCDMFMRLPDERRADIVRGVPTQVPSWIEPRAVSEILQYLADRESGFSQTKARAPDFDVKIEFNGLAGPAADWLRALSYQAAEIDEFLGKRDPYLAQAIAQELHDLYQQSLGAITDEDTDAPALRFIWMRDQLIPDGGKAHPHTLKAYREAAGVVLAKYFETCDIYEEPGPGRRPA